MPFIPDQVTFEPQALEYPRGQELRQRFISLGVPISYLGPGNRVTGITGDTPGEIYRAAKRTLVVRVWKSKEFATCKPSAHYQLPLTGSCPGLCEYCYLQTNLGPRPYLRLYVNLEDIFRQAERYIQSRQPEHTVFEGAATSDPIPLEPYSGSLRQAIEFFGRQDAGRFRFVTKFTDVDTLLDADHRDHTRFRFSCNSERIISTYEHGAPRLAARLEAATRVSEAGYPLGFIIGPIFLDPGWQDEYLSLLHNIAATIMSKPKQPMTFELISHRFTARAKASIAKTFPDSQLPLNESQRVFKFGQFGYGKYLYPPESLAQARAFFAAKLYSLFPDSKIEYFV